MSRRFKREDFNREEINIRSRRGFERDPRFGNDGGSFIQQIRDILAQIREDTANSEPEMGNSIKIPRESLFLGKSKFGPVALDTNNLSDMRILVVGGSGSGKSYLTRRLIEDLLEKNVIVIVCDGEGEWVTLREKYDLILLGKDKSQDDAFGYCDIEINEENFTTIIKACIENNTPMILRLNQWSDLEERQKFVTQLNNFLIHETSNVKYENIAVIFEEAHTFAEKGSKSVVNQKCKNSMRELASQARRRAVSLIFITQRPPKLHTDITSQCNIRLIGKLKSDADLDSVVKYLNLRPKDYYQVNNSLDKQFIAEGDYFYRGHIKDDETLIFKAEKVTSPHLNLREIRSYKIPEPNKPILKTIENIELQGEGNNQKSLQESSEKAHIDENKRKLPGKTLHDTLRERHSAFEKICRCFGLISIRNLYTLICEDYNETTSLFEVEKWVSMNKDSYKIHEDDICAENDDPSIDIGSSEEILTKWIDKLQDDKLAKMLEYLYVHENENNTLKEIAEELKTSINEVKDIVEKYKYTNLFKLQHGDVYLNTIFFDRRIDKAEKDDEEEFNPASIFEDDEFEEM